MDLVWHIDREDDYVSACARNERWAQEIMYKEFYPSMMALCLRYANNKEDARDILHEGFIKVFRHISKYKQGTSLASWIKRIMINTSIDFYRKSVRRRTEDLDGHYDVSNGEPDVISQMTVKDILDCLQVLTPSYRAVFNLYIIEGYSHKEIAVRLEISESTSRSNLVKARTKLKQLLKAKRIKNE